MKKIIQTDNAPAAIGSYSQAVKTGSTLYISGQIPLTVEGELIMTSVEEQTEQVLMNLEAILKEAGGSFNNVVKATIYTDDITYFNEINEAYGKFFKKEPPARAFVEVSALPKGVNVEIEAIAEL